jgi:hypothetical protein
MNTRDMSKGHPVSYVPSRVHYTPPIPPIGHEQVTTARDYRYHECPTSRTNIVYLDISYIRAAKFYLCEVLCDSSQAYYTLVIPPIRPGRVTLPFRVARIVGEPLDCLQGSPEVGWKGRVVSKHGTA